MNEKRQYMRSGSPMVVELSHPGFGATTMKVKDLSDGGLCVLLENHSALPLGAVINASIKRYGGTINEQPVAMEVVHASRSEMGLMFVREP